MRREPHRKMRRMRISVCRRSASFFYLFLESLIWRNGRNGRPKDRPHPCPFLGPDRFRASRDHILLARARAQKGSGAKVRRENENACHESPQTLAQGTPPSPRRGEATDFTASCRECARSTRAPGAGFPRHGPRAPGNPAGRRRVPTEQARRRRPLSGRACRGGTAAAPG
jgi:hypothetical protein